MKKMRYVFVYLNEDIEKGSWIDMSKITLKELNDNAKLMNCNQFIEGWYIEYE